MHPQDLQSLITKYLAGQCTEAEKALLENWYLTWKPEKVAVEEDQMLTTKEEVFAQLPIHFIPKKVALWKYVASVAALLFLALSASLFLLSRDTQYNIIEIAAGSYDIPPGRSGATLTLSNGNVIALSSSQNGMVVSGRKIKYNDGTDLQGTIAEISTEGAPQILKASTGKGQTYEVTLPDGTHVWLNSASSIQFPTVFKDTDKRVVAITGEAYFEVSKQFLGGTIYPKTQRQAFEVHSGNQIVEVLGTHFNINSYGDEHTIMTTLLEGSVRVSAAGNSRILRPNQQAALVNNTFKIAEVQAEDAIDWKRGDFEFNTEPLFSIMHKISRWYDVDVIYEQGVDKSQTFSGKVTREQSISNVLEIMQTTRRLRFKIEGRQVTVMK
ncbi:FecR family protein [Pedobacter sp. PWIIR3]